jgi:hypothetical protein
MIQCGAVSTLTRPQPATAGRAADHRPRRIERAIGLAGVGVTLLVGLALRLHLLGENAVWWDEGWSIWLARQRPDLIARFTAADQHPPLHYWFLWIWDRLAGESAFAVRYGSVLFGLALLPVVYLIGRRLGGTGAGLFAAALLAVARFDVWWSQEIRMYVPLLLLVGLSTYWLLRLLRGGPAWLWLPWALAGLAGLLLTYLAALALAAQALAVLLALPTLSLRRWARPALCAAVGFLAIAAGFLPWWLYRLPYANRWTPDTPADPSLALRVYATVLTLGVSTDIDRFLPLAAALLAVALAGGLALATGARGGMNLRARAHTPAPRGYPPLPIPGEGESRSDAVLLPATPVADRTLEYGSPSPGIGRGGYPLGAGVWARARWWEAALLLLLTAFPALAVYALSRADTSLYAATIQARYFILALPSYAVLVALAVAALLARAGPARLAGGALGAAILALTAASLPDYFDGRLDDQSFTTIAGFIDTYARGDDAIVLYPDTDWPVFFYHYPRGIDWFRLPGGVRMTEAEVDHWLSPAARHTALWLVTSPKAFVNDPQRLVPAWLDAHFRPAASLRAGDLQATLYTTAPALTDRRSRQPANRTGVLEPVDASEAAPSGLAGRPTPGELLAIDPLPSQAPPGATLHLVTYWQTRAPEELTATLTRASSPAVPARRLEPPPQLGPILRIQFDLVVPPGSGAAEVRLRAGERTLLARSLRVLPVPTPADVSPDAPAVALKPADVRFGPEIRLTGWAIRQPPEGPLTLDLAWRADAAPELDYTLFVHLSAPDERILAQLDLPPGRPTSSWQPGEVFHTRVTLTSPPGLHGEFPLYIGLYDAVAFHRLPVLPAGDPPDPDSRLRLTTLKFE